MHEPARLDRLLRAYEVAPERFRATAYWEIYQQRLLPMVQSVRLDRLRSGRYLEIGPFGFNEVVWKIHPLTPWWKRALLRSLDLMGVLRRLPQPYGLRLDDVREMAVRHCALVAERSGAKPLAAIEASRVGAPSDSFEIDGRHYTMSFLGYYLRYCFVQSLRPFGGSETLVELGSGSGTQVELLKKLHPELTILCFDLPIQIYLCESYLREALPGAHIVGTDRTLGWESLSEIEPGAIHFFGSWKIPLIAEGPHDLFWSAASFGEMEPEVVAGYLELVRGSARWVYLLQARQGKETTGRVRVQTPVCFEDYERLLTEYDLVGEEEAHHAHRRMRESGGYVQALWKRRGPLS